MGCGASKSDETKQEDKYKDAQSRPPTIVVVPDPSKKQQSSHHSGDARGGLGDETDTVTRSMGVSEVPTDAMSPAGKSRVMVSCSTLSRSKLDSIRKWVDGMQQSDLSDPQDGAVPKSSHAGECDSRKSQESSLIPTAAGSINCGGSSVASALEQPDKVPPPTTLDAEEVASPKEGPAPLPIGSGSHGS